MHSGRLGALSEHIGRVPMMALDLLGAGLATLVMHHLPSLAWLAIPFVPATITWSISEPAETALVADLTGQWRRGLAYGLYDFFEYLGFVIGPLLGGLAMEWMERATPFYIYGGMSVIGGAIVPVLLLKRGPASSAVKSQISSEILKNTLGS